MTEINEEYSKKTIFNELTKAFASCFESKTTIVGDIKFSLNKFKKRTLLHRI